MRKLTDHQCNDVNKRLQIAVFDAAVEDLHTIYEISVDGDGHRGRMTTSITVRPDRCTPEALLAIVLDCIRQIPVKSDRQTDALQYLEAANAELFFHNRKTPPGRPRQPAYDQKTPVTICSRCGAVADLRPYQFPLCDACAVKDILNEPRFTGNPAIDLKDLKVMTAEEVKGVMSTIRDHRAPALKCARCEIETCHTWHIDEHGRGPYCDPCWRYLWPEKVPHEITAVDSSLDQEEKQ